MSAAITTTPDSRSSTMSQHAMYEVLAREHVSVQANDEQVRRAYLRQLAVLRRRQRKADAAHRAMQSLMFMR
jgi:hypothetical protein